MLTLIMELNKRDKKRQKIGLFECDCGKQKELPITLVTNNRVKSCGCYKPKTYCTYNKGKEKEYQIWIGMKKRCYYHKTNGYENYGGRGISVCERWLHSFKNFYEDMGPRPGNKYKLDRKDNDGNYNPDNCRWATPKESKRNTRFNVFLTHDGKTFCISEWAEKLGVSRNLLWNRKNFGWSDEKIITTPIRKRSTDKIEKDLLNNVASNGFSSLSRKSILNKSD